MTKVHPKGNMVVLDALKMEKGKFDRKNTKESCYFTLNVKRLLTYLLHNIIEKCHLHLNDFQLIPAQSIMI